MWGWGIGFDKGEVSFRRVHLKFLVKNLIKGEIIIISKKIKSEGEKSKAKNQSDYIIGRSPVLGLAAFINPVFKFLKTVPKGKTVTYKAVAKHCGLSNARNIGWILKQNPDPDKIPCYKVVYSNGRLASGYKFGGPKEQKRRLIVEGVKFDGDRVKDY